MVLNSRDVPQADSLNDVIATTVAVANGARTYQEIAQAIGKVERQGRYYRLAAEQIGLLAHHSTNHSVLTNLGEEFINLSEEQRRVLLADLVLRNSSVQVVFEGIAQNPGLSRNQVISLLVENGIKENVAERRCSTIIIWLTTLSLIRRQDGGFVALWRPTFEGQAILEIAQRELTRSDGGHPLLTEIEDVWTGDFIEAANGIITYEVSQELRQRAMTTHQLLVGRMVSLIRSRGAVPRCSRNIDLTAQLPEGHYIFEMKSCNQQNSIHQIRRGLSQLYEYRFRYSASLQNPNLWLVLEQPIRDEWYVDYLVRDRAINLCWQSGDTFESPGQCREALLRLATGP